MTSPLPPPPRFAYCLCGATILQPQRGQKLRCDACMRQRQKNHYREPSWPGTPHFEDATIPHDGWMGCRLDIPSAFESRRFGVGGDEELENLQGIR